MRIIAEIVLKNVEINVTMHNFTQRALFSKNMMIVRKSAIDFFFRNHLALAESSSILKVRRFLFRGLLLLCTLAATIF